MKQVLAHRRSISRAVTPLSVAVFLLISCRTEQTPRTADKPSPELSMASVTDLRVRIDSVRCYQDLTPEGVRTRDQAPAFFCYARIILDNRNRSEGLEGLSIPTSMFVRSADGLPVGTMQWQSAWDGTIAAGGRDTIELVSDHLVPAEHEPQTICDNVYALMIVIAQSGSGSRTAMADSVYVYCQY